MGYLLFPARSVGYGVPRRMVMRIGQMYLDSCLRQGEKTPKNLVEGVYGCDQAIAQKHLLGTDNFAGLINAQPKYREAQSLAVLRARG